MEYVILSATGRVARLASDQPWAQARASAAAGQRQPHDVIAAAAPAYDGAIALVAADGLACRVATADLPSLDPTAPWSLAEAPSASDLGGASEPIIGLACLDLDAPPLALATRWGVVKRVTPEYKGWPTWTVIALKDGDRVVGCAAAADPDDLVMITDDAQVLRLSAREVRPQGRAAGGMAGMKLADGAQVIHFAAVAKADRDQAVVATLAVGGDAANVKTTPLAQFPAKGRATGGVRGHRFLTGQSRLGLAWVGLPPVKAGNAQGLPRNLPPAEDRRDGSGTKVYGLFTAFGG